MDAEEDELPRPIGKDLGSVSNYFEGGQKYLSYLKETIDNDFEDINIALDCAHGATSRLAPRFFGEFEADIHTLGHNLTVLNINDKVGAIQPQKLQELVVQNEADICLAFYRYCELL